MNTGLLYIQYITILQNKTIDCGTTMFWAKYVYVHTIYIQYPLLSGETGLEFFRQKIGNLIQPK